MRQNRVDYSSKGDLSFKEVKPDEKGAKVGITRKDAGNVVDAVARTVTNTLEKGETVTLVGFGTFRVMERNAKRGRNLGQERLSRHQQGRFLG